MDTNKMIFTLFLIVGTLVQAQKIDYNTKKGYAVNGYDVVSYFDGLPKEGDEEYVVTYDHVKFKFANLPNKKRFVDNFVKYLPQYGGYCAYAVAINAKKVDVNPETYEIRDGKLYLFYNRGKNNTLQFWLNESPKDLKCKADKNWEKIKN
ncbi:hypothetical protein Murru_2028 [Allomuricauda ruestringensis DSM 13258]|uniref:YHS domain-containing protein n=1 Tax=Allomuricauda ruestringensis (strain DSM 13258 / CIP 107369 / LMG 19739 / B1) TaxID=886377 RepID=G2PL38_ALLRU|nr:YHS domain-containing (seleno)protein [Allomuricauda ruestringensis]AEM71067.1 hypothetical protein Murru_2028 [Allomuricauda ruestringensis DSM 13258]